MYTLHSDKPEKFTCKIEVEGASLLESKVRLVAENSNHSLLWEGKVSSNGECVVELGKVKNLLKEGTTGNIRLEVIADDTYFIPWEDTYTVKKSKKVVAEVTSNVEPEKPSRPKVKAQVKEQATPKKKKLTKVNKQEKEVEILTSIIKEAGITKKNYTNKLQTIQQIVEYYRNTYSSNSNTKSLMVEVLKML